MEILQLAELIAPFPMLAFMTWMYLKAEQNHREDKAKRDKTCKEEHERSEVNLIRAYEHCEENAKETRALHLAERDRMWDALKEVSDKNQKVMQELTAAIKDRQRILPINLGGMTKNGSEMN